jgi:alanine racemase
MRQGVLLEDLEEFIRCARKSSNIIIEGIYTHFANIEDTTDHSFAKEQLRKFNQALQIAKELKIKPLAHTACSAALILFPETHFDIVRFGISMYGYWSSPQTLVSSKENKKSILLKPALSWKSVIAQIKNVKSGTSIGYGLMEKTNQDTKIAIVPVGYWDGYDRKLSSVGNVLIGGKRCKIIGRICMNMLMVDINHLPDVKIEDEVVLIGQQGEENITVEELAQKVGTINYEIITRINPLIPRIYK